MWIQSYRIFGEGKKNYQPQTTYGDHLGEGDRVYMQIVKYWEFDKTEH